MNSASVWEGRSAEDKLFFFAHYEGIRIALPICHAERRCPRPPISNMCWGNLPLAEMTRSQAPPSGATRGDSVLSKTCSRCCRLGGSPVAITAARWTHRDSLLPAKWHAARWQRLCDPAAAVSEQQRQREPDRVEDRSHHQCQRQRLVSLPAGHGPAGGIPIRSTPSSTLIRRSRSARWSWVTRICSVQPW